MSRSTLRTSIIVLTAITALIHLVLLNIGMYFQTGAPDLLFSLNGIGFFVLLWALLYARQSFLVENRRLVALVYIAFTLVTILAWLLLNGDFSSPVGVFTKLVEVLLVIALFLYMRPETAA